jgi:4'-phosphopantetheinyl transferase
MQPGSVRLWTLAVSGEEPIDAWLPRLDEPERAQAARFHRAADRVHYVLAHALLRAALSETAARPLESWRFERGAQGKPLLPAADNALGLDVSLAHTGGLVACAIGRDCQVGVDAERIDARHAGPGPAGLVFAAAERRDLAATTGAAAVALFFRYWSLREAYLKAVGLGLGFDPESFVMTTSPVAIGFPSGDDDPGRWRFHEPAVSPAHAVAVAVGLRPGSAHVFEHRHVSAVPSALP